VRRIKRLVLEVHRRSLWQVLSIYLFGSWITMQVVQALTVSAGLPDWVPGFGLVLLLVGLPIVLATAFVQEGGPVGAGPERAASLDGASHDGASHDPASPGPTPSVGASTGASAGPGPRRWSLRLFTWRNAVVGGVLAFALLGVAATAFTGMRTLGIGPVATLRAQGVFEEGERVILADFVNASADSLLGSVVTTALRVDLLQSPALVLLERAELARALRRMQLDPGAALDARTALEIAVREGIKAVLEGEVGALGSGYVVTATLRAAEDGRSLAGFRATARSADDLIPAVDHLSRQIREKAGESLRTVRAGVPLVEVTTASLPALRKLTEADAAARRGEFDVAIPLLREAVALDTAFAMGWRYLGIALSNSRIDQAGQLDAVTRAHRHGARLPERERYLAAAAYHRTVTRDREQAMHAYRSVLRLDPADPTALNNLAILYQDAEQFEEADQLYRQVVAGRSGQASGYHNLVFNSVALNRLDDARAAAREYARAFPADPRLLDGAAWTEWAAGDLDQAEALARRMADSLQLPTLPRAFAQAHLGLYALERGQYRRAREHMARYADGLDAASPGSGVVPRVGLAQRWFYVGADPAALVREIDDIVASDLWTRQPAEARPYGVLIHTYAALGAGDRVREFLAEWEAAAPTEGRRSDQERDRLAWLGILALRQGDPAEAARQLEAARAVGGCRRCFRSYLAEAYEELGRLDEAIALHEAAYTEFHAFAPEALLHRMVANERLGPLYEAMGDRDRAMAAYARFLDRWRNADPELRTRVQTAERALARLRADG
jgi:eukaryotic-like serine/threonine-protein kinase